MNSLATDNEVTYNRMNMTYGQFIAAHALGQALKEIITRKTFPEYFNLSDYSDPVCKDNTSPLPEYRITFTDGFGVSFRPYTSIDEATGEYYGARVEIYSPDMICLKRWEMKEAAV